MDKQVTSLGKRIDYTSNLLGNIRSHLQGLQGFDTMALELIQNADDAKAKHMVFDIQEAGLSVWNSGVFDYCGDLDSPCSNFEEEGYTCDFHRISDFGSGGKLSRSENIGRFGVGFSSTYQITDQPEIHSSGIKLTLVPEEQNCYHMSDTGKEGTTFFLPWATAPDTKGRLALGVSHITPEHIDQIKNDCEDVLQRSLLFLRHLEKAELRHNGQHLLSVELKRKSDSELTVLFSSKEEEEQWFVLRADAGSELAELYGEYAQLEQLDRNTKITIAIRVAPTPLENGLLYAFLPTQQSSGLPFHLNADFFPEGSRKSIIFEGHQYQQAWNELLVNTAAKALADNLELLRDHLDHRQIWDLLARASKISSNNDSQHPECFDAFWEEFRNTVENGTEVGYSVSNQYALPSQLYIPRKLLTTQQLDALHTIGCELVNDDLRPYYNTLISLGVRELKLKQFIEVVNLKPLTTIIGEKEIADKYLNDLLKPLWEVIEQLLTQESNIEEAGKELGGLALVINTNQKITTINDCYKSPSQNLKENQLASVFSFIPYSFIGNIISEYPKLYGLVDVFGIETVVIQLKKTPVNNNINDLISDGSQESLSRFYHLLSKLDAVNHGDEDNYDTLKKLPIWKVGDKFATIENALLAGDFEDPTGQAQLLDESVLTSKSKVFIKQKLGVKHQTIEEFIHTVIPLFVGESGPSCLDAYHRLILSLSSHANLVDNGAIVSLLSQTKLVPIADGGWQRPSQVYFYSKKLAEILGNNGHLWIDEERLPNKLSVHTFIKHLGVLESPAAPHLVDRMLELAQAFKPDSKARKASENAFYELCDISRRENITDEVGRLNSMPCLPVNNDKENWYLPEEIYAPFRYQAFESQASILDFKNTQKLSPDLLDVLSIKRIPETTMVVDHLLHCVDNDVPASSLIYQVLDERANQDKDELLRLNGKRCIYLGRQYGYVRPNQLYLYPQTLGKYSFSMPGDLDRFKNLFSAIGVKDNPEPHDYIDILLDIIEEYHPKQIALPSDINAIYTKCFQSLVDWWNSSQDRSTVDTSRLQEAPSIINIQNALCYPDEILIHDSEWHAKHFADELNQVLCKPDKEWWSFLNSLGVRNLTEVGSVKLGNLKGDKKLEREFIDQILERKNVFIRIMHDKQYSFKITFLSSLESMSVYSYQQVQVVASVIIDNTSIESEASEVKAFYDDSNNTLVLAQPIDSSSPLHAFTSLLHCLMPEELASEITKIGMLFDQMMTKSVLDAHEYLSMAGIPVLKTDEVNVTDADLASAEIDSLGQDSVEDTELEEAEDSTESGSELNSEQEETSTVKTHENNPDGESGDDVSTTSLATKPTTSGGINGSDGDKKAKSTVAKGSNTKSIGTSTGSRRSRRKRATYKKQWDRKLISYVKHKSAEIKKDDDTSDASAGNEYNLSIEAASRELVCKYERKRGREAEEMSQTHPGFDIISYSLETGEVDRYIEVKGTSGEWNRMGVSVSKYQFTEAQKYGQNYWLYVVDNALDNDKAQIFPIQNPAGEVSSFMFDGGWKDAVTDEDADPSLLYIAGACIDCGVLGKGIIKKVEKRGLVKSLIVDFGTTGGTKLMPLNLKTMKIIED